MKKQLLGLFLIIFLFSCEKKEVITDNSQYVTGSYIGFKIYAEGNTFPLPYNGLRASCLIARTGTNKVAYAFTLYAPNQDPQTLKLECKIVAVSSDDYKIVEETTELEMARKTNGVLACKIVGQDVIVYLQPQ